MGVGFIRCVPLYARRYTQPKPYQRSVRAESYTVLGSYVGEPYPDRDRLRRLRFLICFHWTAQATLNTRRGAAFGFASIAKLASAQMAAHLPSLVPKLYRMQSDPNPKVQEAMGAIWKALVDDPRKALDEHFDAVMKELLKEIGSRQWRNRESSCSALADLMQGRRYSVRGEHAPLLPIVDLQFT